MKLKGKDYYMGRTFKTKSYGDCVVKGYKDSSNVTILFESTGYETVVSAANLRKGLVRDLLSPFVCGVGYLGKGRYQCRNKTADGMRTPEYSAWETMIRRVYDPQESSFRNYIDVAVCDDWHNFQNFAEWCQTQKGFAQQGFQLDKDLLVPGNRTYAPDVCCFIPQHINSALTGAKYTNTSGCAGVAETLLGKYSVAITMNSTSRYMGTFDTFEQAQFVYKTMKEAYVRSLAVVYKDGIREDAFNALISWEVPCQKQS